MMGQPLRVELAVEAKQAADAALAVSLLLPPAVLRLSGALCGKTCCGASHSVAACLRCSPLLPC